MFGFFSRKQQPVAKVPDLPSSDPMIMAVDSEPRQLRTPSPSEAAFNGFGLLHPSIAMSLPTGPSADSSIPIPLPAVPPTPEALHSLVTSIPAKTLHAYLLDNIPAAPSDTLVALSSLFATLSPPPVLHCVRCHEDYTDIENGDRSCHVPHDDDSAEVEWVGHKRGDSDYETYYHCCGKTVEGEGDLGPPDGWCYEGMHTTDARRARFRSDSTNADDKLATCFQLNCNNIRARIPNPKKNAGASASTSGRASRGKRARSPADEDGGFEGTEDAGIAEVDADAPSPSPKTKSKSKGKSKARAPKPKAETMTATPASTPARGRGRTLSRMRVQVPRSVGQQESDAEVESGRGKAPTATATRASRQRRRSDAKPRSAAPSPATPAPRQTLRSDAKPRSAPSSPASKATSPPSSPNARGRKSRSPAKMDSVEIMVTQSRSRTRSRVRGSGAETGDEKTARGTAERPVRKRRKVAHTATA